jgi:DNA polymerase III sliding clamp (beta) subunit (PCNA family)
MSESETLPQNTQPDPVQQNTEQITVPQPTVTPAPPEPKHALFEWNESQYFKKILQLIDVFSDEAVFVVDAEKLSMTVMDPSRVSMLTLTLPKEAMEEFNATEVLPKMLFTVNVTDLVTSVFKNTYKGESVRWLVEDSFLETVLRERVKRTFKRVLLENPSDESEYSSPQPKITHTFKGRFVLENLNTIFKDTSGGEAVRLIGNSEKLLFRVDDPFYESEAKKGDDTTLSIECSEPEVKSTYSVSYLKEALKALFALSQVVTISYATDMPLKLEADLENYGTATIWIAPRIETE